ncbi:F-box/kelch-repeat protein At3g23880-like [Vigna unguiculata]|uniref:F-box/kelch-repeat protein At3g23880-like n=1 Tax=Vigna unguiculata TaxID=3917 RepID=UPI001016B052|nr:F-box/kelch-repeat protein At3g23880-like [Vigna unguiculata]
MNRPTLCEELQAEILSWLRVKTLLRFKCVSKSFHSLISDPWFVKLHLQRSPRGVDLLLEYLEDDNNLESRFLVPCHIGSLSDNHKATVAHDRTLGFDISGYGVIGSCNGLVCMAGRCKKDERCMFCVWNPATRETLEDLKCSFPIPSGHHPRRKVAFGYDDLSHAYKVVLMLDALDLNRRSIYRDVKVCNVGGNSCWRSVESFPAKTTMQGSGWGVYLNSTLNWVGLDLHDNHPHDSYITFDESVIVSLDLRNEKSSQFMLPQALHGICMNGICMRGSHSLGYDWDFHDCLGVLKDCLTVFFHDHNKRHISIWQMRDFGNHKSWSLSLNIAMQDLQIVSMPRPYLHPLIMLEENEVLFIEGTYKRIRRVIYDRSGNIVEHPQIHCNIFGIYPMAYVQSLVSQKSLGLCV